MLTIEMLRANPATMTLSQDVMQAIATMSQNDESTVIGTRIGELHGQYDADVLSVTGVAKNQGEKTYDYVKRVLNNYKNRADSAKATKAELDVANAKVADLEAKLASNSGDAELQKQLKDAKNQVSQLQTQLKDKEAEYTTKVANLEKANKDVHIQYAFKAATAGLKFKDGITEAVQTILLDSALQQVLTKGTPDFIDDGKGGKTLVFRDANNNIINNPKNNLNPYTMKELVMETSLKDVLTETRQQQGGGTNTVRPTQNNSVLDLSGYKTQVEADKHIEAHLLANGLTRDSSEFSEQFTQIRTDNNVSNLPIR